MVKLSCPNKHCSEHGKVGGNNLTKYGKDRHGLQRYFCKTCGKTFTLPEPPQPQPWQRKKAQKGVKSMRGRPEIYDEVKEKITFSLTPTAVKALNQYAASLNISRSELVERLARGLIPLATVSAEKNDDDERT